MNITEAELARVRKRHAGIEQDALPLDLADVAPAIGAAKTKTVKSVKWAKCPHHAPSGRAQLTGLVRLDADTLVFRDHTKTVGKHTVPCPGSGESHDDTTADTQPATETS